MDPEELKKIIAAHDLWLKSKGKEGKRAELQNANLKKADFTNTNLTDANLEAADLEQANFDHARLDRTILREANLQNANFENAEFFLTRQLAGTNVAGAKLPDPIAEFEGLKVIAEATSNAQKVFIAMLGGCVYCWLTIGTTTDVALLTNSASSPLPIIQTPLPIVGFYYVAPMVLLAIYFYFHLNMQRLWEALADLPAVFPDGKRLDQRADPWLLNGLVTAHFARLRGERPALSRFQECLSILLAWWVVPTTLFVFSGRFLVRHEILETVDVHAIVLSVAIGFGWMSYRLARATLRRIPQRPFRWAIIGALLTLAIGFGVHRISLSAIAGRLSHDTVEQLKMLGFRPFADVSGADISTKPANWTESNPDYPSVKGASLHGAHMERAVAERAFLVNADLSDAKLEEANFAGAKLQRANLIGAHMRKINLPSAHLEGAHLGGITALGGAHLEIYLGGGRLPGTEPPADLGSANLEWAHLEQADLHGANLEGADLRSANLSGAILANVNIPAYAAQDPIDTIKLKGAELAGANLEGANLSGVDLSHTTGLTKSQLSNSIKDDKTLLPDNLPP